VVISLHTALWDWQTGPLELTGLGIEAALAVGYCGLVARVKRDGGEWPIARLVCFVGGLAVLAVSLQSGFARYDEIFWVHVVQHQLLMCAAPALIAVGAPVVLALRALPAANGRRLVGVLHGPALNWMNGRRAAVHLPAHYFGMMYLYLLTPAYALSESNAAFHEFVHLYFIGCGLMFWAPVLHKWPSRWHPARDTRVWMVVAGLPAMLVLAGLVAAFAPIGDTSVHETLVGAAALALSSVATTVFGLWLVAMTAPRRRLVPTGGGLASRAALVASRRA
jgi:cytochrome c oxidase assembly factor CtaG